MVHSDAIPDHSDMSQKSQKRDGKIDRIGALLGRGWSERDLTALCRLGDIGTVPAGSVLHREDSLTKWCYWMLSGAAVVSCEGDPLLMCGPGSILPGGATLRSGRAPASVEALDDADVIAFRLRDFKGALDTIRPLRALTTG